MLGQVGDHDRAFLTSLPMLAISHQLVLCRPLFQFVLALILFHIGGDAIIPLGAVQSRGHLLRFDELVHCGELT